MVKTARWMALLAAMAFLPTCKQAENDCERNPELECYVNACGQPGIGACLGKPCSSGGDCASGSCADNTCCDTTCDGLCETCAAPGLEGICSSLPVGTVDFESPAGETCEQKGGCGEDRGFCACEDGIGNGTETDVDCGGACGPCSLGETCAAAVDCQSGFCVDGACCNAECNLPCRSCNLPMAPGLCIPVASGTPDPGCSALELCSPYGGCLLAPGQVCTQPVYCNSVLCVGTVCANCSQTADCALNEVCDNGACVAMVGNGAQCQSGLACQSGSCVDGVCCAEACSGACMGCNQWYTGMPSGTCAPILPGLDPHDDCNGPGGSGSCSGEIVVGGRSSCGIP